MLLFCVCTASCTDAPGTLLMKIIDNKRLKPWMKHSLWRDSRGKADRGETLRSLPAIGLQGDNLPAKHSMCNSKSSMFSTFASRKQRSCYKTNFGLSFKIDHDLYPRKKIMNGYINSDTHKNLILTEREMTTPHNWDLWIKASFDTRCASHCLYQSCPQYHSWRVLKNLEQHFSDVSFTTAKLLKWDYLKEKNTNKVINYIILSNKLTVE